MRNDGVVKEIAAERIPLLFGLALREARRDIGLSRGYIRTLKRISQHYKVHVPNDIDSRICGHCNTVLMPGLTATVRLVSSKGFVSYRCDSCGRERHVFYKAAK